MAVTLRLTRNDGSGCGVMDKVLAVVGSYVLPDSTQSASSAAAALEGQLQMHYVADHDRARSAESELECFLWYMWDVLHMIAEQLPPLDAARIMAQDRLAELVRTLRQYPSQTPVVTLGDWGTYKLWQDLPLWNVTFCEAWNVVRCEATSNPDAWRGINAYIMRAARDVPGLVRFYGVEALSNSLDRHAPAPEADSAPTAVAAEWLRLFGPHLRRAVMEEGDDGGAVDDADSAAATDAAVGMAEALSNEEEQTSGEEQMAGDEHFSGEEQMSNEEQVSDEEHTSDEKPMWGEELWQSWKRSWAEIAQLAATDDITRRVAHESLAAMKRLEREA